MDENAKIDLIKVHEGSINEESKGHVVPKKNGFFTSLFKMLDPKHMHEQFDVKSYV